jgi:Flp pilus assembly protein TadD
VEAPTNYRGHLWYGDSLMRAGDRIGGERALRRALALWPAHDGALLLLAVAYQNAGLCDAAMPLYRRAIELEPLKPAPRFGLGGCYMSQRRYSAARRTAVEATAQVSRSLRAFNITILLADSALAATDTIRPNNRWLHRRQGGAAGR